MVKRKIAVFLTAAFCMSAVWGLSVSAAPAENDISTQQPGQETVVTGPDTGTKDIAGQTGDTGANPEDQGDGDNTGADNINQPETEGSAGNSNPQGSQDNQNDQNNQNDKNNQNGQDDETALPGLTAPGADTLPEGTPPKEEEPTAQTGFQFEEGNWYYYDNGVKVIGLYEFEEGERKDKVYYFDENGAMQTGFHKITADTAGNADEVLIEGTYYFSEDTTGQDETTANPGDIFGQVQTGLQTIDGKTYYFGEDLKYGAMQYDFQQIGDDWYYFGEDQGDGVMRTGWQVVRNCTYWFEDEGTMAYDFKKVGDKWYYFGNANDGAMKKNTLRVVRNCTYYFDADGVMAHDFKKINGNWYYFGGPDDGAMKKNAMRVVRNCTYYFDANGVMAYDFKKVNGNWYYFGGADDGAMKKNTWRVVRNCTYHFDANGVMAHGFKQIDGKRYYFGNADDGAMKRNHVRNIDGLYYRFGSDGVMVTGWYKEGGNWYLYMPSGAQLRNSWYNENGKRYLLLPDGRMAVGGHHVAPYNYRFRADGSMITGWYQEGSIRLYYTESGAQLCNSWFTDNGKTYYFLWDGLMAKGYHKVAGNYYYLQSDGSRLENGWAYAEGYKYYFGRNGARSVDIRGVNGGWVRGSYRATINKNRCIVTIWAKDSSTGNWNVPVVAFACSVGTPTSLTPTGTYNTMQKYRWHTLMGPSYGQYCTRIVGGILFHSVAGYNMTSYNLNASDYNMLGRPASHGCVRLCVRDAKWIYDNCSLGMRVTIANDAAAPFPQPATIKIPAGQNWDPTDPNV